MSDYGTSPADADFERLGTAIDAALKLLDCGFEAVASGGDPEANGLFFEECVQRAYRTLTAERP